MNTNQEGSNNAKKENLTRIACGIIWGRGGRDGAEREWIERMLDRFSARLSGVWGFPITREDITNPGHGKLVRIPRAQWGDPGA